MSLNAQSLYVPGGAATGVGASSTSNVGIGTSAPGALLDIHSNLGPVIRLQNDAGGAGGGGSIDFNGYPVGSYSPTARLQSIDDGNFSSHIAFLTKTTGSMVNSLVERMRVASNGNVGIGTTKPLRPLHLYGANGYCEELWEAGAVSSSSLGRIWRWGTDPLGNFSASTCNSDLSVSLNVLTFSSGGQLRLTGPGQAVSTGLNDIGNSGGTLYLQDNGGAPSNGGAVRFGAQQGSFAAIKSEITDGSGSTVGNLSFETRNASTDTALTPRLFIRSDGNVGVGTTNPTQKLSVNGTIQAKEVVVQTGWSDYVFADDYALPALSDVETEVKRTRHLPGIPSADDVVHQGINLGEMQARLLAKVEELTLHLIEQEKRINLQTERMDRLEKENAQLRNTP